MEQWWFITNVRIGFPVPGCVENAVRGTTFQPARFQVMSERIRGPQIDIRVPRAIIGGIEKTAFVDQTILFPD
jgi:hypothetical protein